MTPAAPTDGPTGLFVTYDPHHARAESRVEVYTLACRSCGFEPVDGVVPPRKCPKCGSGTFERFVRPGSILENANRT